MSGPSSRRSMRVVLQIVDGPDTGRKILLRSRHELKVGRTSWAEFVCEHDTKMSRVHFRVVTDSVGCYLEDLQSSNGTYLNDQPITNERLKHNDLIRAGLTTFRVQMEGDRPDMTGSYVGVPEQHAPAGKPASGGPVHYRRQTCHSGVMQYSFSVDAVSPAVLAEQLSHAWPLYLMLDFTRLGAPRPEDLQGEELLFNWLPAEVANELPVFFSQHSSAEVFKLIEQGYASDSVVCLFSSANAGQLLEHLRITGRSQLHGQDSTPGIYGICWPSVLGAMLPSGEEAYVARVMSCIDAVLLCPPADPTETLLFGDEKLERMLQSLGYDREPENEQVEEQAAS